MTVILPLRVVLVVCDGETEVNGWPATLLQLDASIEGLNSVAVNESAIYKSYTKELFNVYLYVCYIFWVRCVPTVHEVNRTSVLIHTLTVCTCIRISDIHGI